MIEIIRQVETRAPREIVAPFLTDFTTTAEWDPHTQACSAVGDGPVAVGREYDNVQRIGPMRSRFRYRVREFEPGRRIVLASESSLLAATDAMEFADRAGGGTRVTYTARFRLKGVARLGAPVLQRLVNRIGDDGAAGMRRRLDALADQPSRSRPSSSRSSNPS